MNVGTYPVVSKMQNKIAAYNDTIELTEFIHRNCVCRGGSRKFKTGGAVEFFWSLNCFDAP